MRVLLRSRVSTLVAVFALALGVGVNATMFVSVNSLILHPMPYPTLERIMTVWSSPHGAGGERDLMASGDFADIQRQNRSFERLAAFEQRDVALTGIGQPEELLGCGVTKNFFPVFGMQPLLGRHVRGFRRGNRRLLGGGGERSILAGTYGRGSGCDRQNDPDRGGEI